MARLIVKRKNKWINRFRNIGLYLDNTKIGSIGNGQMEEFTSSPGVHTLKAKIDWCSSNKHSFTLSDKETYTVTIEPYKYATILTAVEIVILAAHFIANYLYGVDYILWLVIPFFMVNLYYLTFGSNRFLVIREDNLSFSF
jgi:hypothetical protein